MYHKDFKHLPWTESIEVAGDTIGGLGTQKSTFSGVNVIIINCKFSSYF